MEAEGQALFFFFFCATSHDRFCCLTQDFFGRSGLARPMSCFMFYQKSSSVSGVIKFPLPIVAAVKAPHCSCSNMFFWKG